MEPVTMGLLALGGGALLGGASSLLGGSAQEEAARIQAQKIREAQEFSNRMTGQANIGLNQAYGDVSGMYSPYIGAGTTALSELAGGNFQTNPGQFNFQGDVNQYLDPSMAYQQQQASRSLQQSALGQGNLLSGGTAKALQDQAMQMGQQDYANAFQRMQQDKNFAYKTFSDDFTRRQAENALRMQRVQGLAGMGANATGNLANNRMGVAQGQSQNLMNNAGIQGGLYSDLGQANAMGATAYKTAGANALGNMANMAGPLSSILMGGGK